MERVREIREDIAEIMDGPRGGAFIEIPITEEAIVYECFADRTLYLYIRKEGTREFYVADTKPMPEEQQPEEIWIAAAD